MPAGSAGRNMANRRAGILGGAVLALTVGVVALLAGFGSRAQVSGGTPKERIAAIYDLARRRPRGTFDALAAAATGDSDAEVRRVATGALMQVAPVEARDTFVQCATDRAPKVRLMAVKALGACGDGPAAEALMQRFRSDDSAEVRRAALDALSRCDQPAAIVLLLQTAENDRADRQDRIRALAALARRLSCRVTKVHRPENTAMWRNLIERFKHSEAVASAYAEMDVPLIHHPGDLLHGSCRHGQHAQADEGGP